MYPLGKIRRVRPSDPSLCFYSTGISPRKWRVPRSPVIDIYWISDVVTIINTLLMMGNRLPVCVNAFSVLHNCHARLRGLGVFYIFRVRASSSNRYEIAIWEMYTGGLKKVRVRIHTILIIYTRYVTCIYWYHDITRCILFSLRCSWYW